MKCNSVFGRLFFIRLPALFAIMIGTLGVVGSFNASAGGCVGFTVKLFSASSDVDDAVVFVHNPVTLVSKMLMVYGSGDGVSLPTNGLRSTLTNLYLTQKTANFSTTLNGCGGALTGVTLGTLPPY